MGEPAADVPRRRLCILDLGALCRRATHVLPAFEPRLALQLIEEERGTFLPAVPTMLMAMLEHPDFATFDLSSLEVVMSGGASIPPELVLRVESHMGAKFGAVFGQTETCGVICISHPSDSTPDKTLRVGQPLEQSEVKIVAAGSDIAVPCGEVGEICVRGFGVMVGYFDSAEQTAQAITTDGWLHTGDLGTMDDRGYLAVTGRLKEMIIRGGENIFPREIEDRLHEHPDVADAAVVGVPDARWGEEAVAFVRPAAGASPAPLELEAFLRERLAGHKVPRRWVMLDELPITLSGKVQKSGCGSSTRPVRSRRECRTSAPRAPARGIRRRCSARIESWRRPEPAWPRRRLIGVLFEGEQQSEPQELRVGDETLRLLAHVRAANKSSLLLKCQ